MAKKQYDSLDASGDFHSSSMQSAHPQNPSKNLEELPKKMLISDIHTGSANLMVDEEDQM